MELIINILVFATIIYDITRNPYAKYGAPLEKKQHGKTINDKSLSHFTSQFLKLNQRQKTEETYTSFLSHSISHIVVG